VEELQAERGVTVDHVSVYRWVQRFTPLLIVAARPCRHIPGDRWFVDETYAKVSARWIYLYRAIDQFGQVIDVLVTEKRDMDATRRFFTRALESAPAPDRGKHRPRARLPPCARRAAARRLPRHRAVHHQLHRGRPRPAEIRLRPMRGLKRLRSARVISLGHELGVRIRGRVQPRVCLRNRKVCSRSKRRRKARHRRFISELVSSGREDHSHTGFGLRSPGSRSTWSWMMLPSMMGSGPSCDSHAAR
jgi:IS6 family transposase